MIHLLASHGGDQSGIIILWIVVFFIIFGGFGASR